MLVVAPVEGKADSFRRDRLERLHDPEQRGKAILRRRPVREPDRAPRLHDSGELARGRFVIGREHDAAGRGDDVEGAVLELEVLAVADAVVDAEIALFRALLGGLDEGRRKIDAGDVGSLRGCELGNCARPAGKIEPFHARLRSESVDHARVDVRDRLRDVLVGALAPDDALLLLQLFESHRFPSSVTSRLVSRAAYFGAVGDLFSDAANERLPETAPLALRMRPQRLE